MTTSDVPDLAGAPLARMVLVGGASGSGKSRLAVASGLPLVKLDDFYRAGDDPDLPRLDTGEIDWDAPGSWNAEQALAAIESLARTGSAEVPIYEIAANGPNGSRTIDLQGASVFVAEGIFVGEIAAEARRRGFLHTAVCVDRSRWATMVFRLARDLREHRKSPAFLLRRGYLLAKREPVIVGRLTAAGCTPMRPRAIRRLLARVERSNTEQLEASDRV